MTMDETQAVFRLTGPSVKDRVVVDRGGVTFGRTQDNEVVLDDRQISRHHMRIYWQDGGFWIEDMGSTNGVRLNDDRLDAHQPVRLIINDMISAGMFTLVFEREVRLPGSTPEIDAETNGFNLDGPSFVPRHAGVFEESRSPIYPPEYNVNRTSPKLVSIDDLLPKVRPRMDRYPNGIPQVSSNWLEYLPGIYSDPNLDPTGFMGRYLWIFESIMNPIIWQIDNFDLDLAPETAPEVWLEWLASWFDLMLIPQLPEERKRRIVRQLGWLFLRRGTRLGLERLLELYFGVTPEVIDLVDDRPFHFVVRLPISSLPADETRLDPELADYLIDSQKPAFTSYTLEVI